MLKAMRKNIKSLAPILWIVIAAFVITIFAVWGGAGRIGESKTSGTIVTVGKEKISSEFYVQNLAQRLESLRNEFKELNKNLIQQLNIPQQVLEQIIQQTLLLQIAEEKGIYASTEEIREEIKSYPVFQRDGKFIGFKAYKRILDVNNISISEFEESLKKNIILEKTIKVLTVGISLAPEELWESYKNRNETAKFEFAILETDKIELKEEPYPSEIRQYFEENKEDYKIPEKREASIVFLETEELKKEVELSELEIENYYKENQPQFEEPERIKVSRIYLPYEDKEKELVTAEAQSILEDIKNGKDFGELAKKFSKDEKAINNGDWGLYDWNRLSSKEKNEIENLSEGETSGFVELDEGISILKATEKNPSIMKPLEEVKERIRSILKDKRAREMAEDRIFRVEKIARKMKSLVEGAQRNGQETKNTGLLKEREAIEEIDPSGTISAALFQLKEKEISSPIYIFKGVGIVQLEKIELLRQAQVEEVEDDVKEDLLAVRKKEKALEKMKKVKSELTRRSLEDLAEKYSLEYRTVNEHKRGQYLSVIGENSKVDQQAFLLPLNEPSEPIEFEGGYVLIRLLYRKEVTQEEFEKEKETEKENFLEMKRNKFLHSYLTKLRTERGVKIKYDLFLKINSDILSRFGGEE